MGKLDSVNIYVSFVSSRFFPTWLKLSKINHPVREFTLSTLHIFK